MDISQVIWIAGRSTKNRAWSTSALRSKKKGTSIKKIFFKKSNQAVLLKAIDTWIRPIVEVNYFLQIKVHQIKHDNEQPKHKILSFFHAGLVWCDTSCAHICLWCSEVCTSSTSWHDLQIY